MTNVMMQSMKAISRIATTIPPFSLAVNCVPSHNFRRDGLLFDDTFRLSFPFAFSSPRFARNGYAPNGSSLVSCCGDGFVSSFQLMDWALPGMDAAYQITS